MEDNPSTTIKISKEHHRRASEMAKRNRRSVAGQVEFLIDTEFSLMDDVDAAVERIRKAVRRCSEVGEAQEGAKQPGMTTP